MPRGTPRWSRAARRRLQDLAVEDIHPNPDQPSKHFDGQALRALADLSRARGVLIIVRGLQVDLMLVGDPCRAMLVAATITEHITTWATHVVTDLGLIGIFVLMLLDAACVPIPSEITMVFAGFGVSQGHDHLISVTAAGVLGNVVGSWLAYYMGRYGRRNLEANAFGRRILRPEHLAVADRWFARYGDASVLVGRLLPVVRTFISLPAGAAGMPVRRFTVLTVIGCVPWVLAFAWLGTLLGANWDSVKPGLQYADYAVLGLALLAVAWVVLRRRRAEGGP
ncbi:MAG TPA: VTT domain-containing protein [Chloroflexota bacterium]